MGLSLAPVGHVHRCPAEGGHDWVHPTYSCERDAEMVCPEHDQADRGT